MKRLYDIHVYIHRYNSTRDEAAENEDVMKNHSCTWLTMPANKCVFGICSLALASSSPGLRTKLH